MMFFIFVDMLMLYGEIFISCVLFGMLCYLLLQLLFDLIVVLCFGMVMVVLCCQMMGGMVEVGFFDLFKCYVVLLLLNMVGCQIVVEVVIIVYMVCEVFGIDWIKFELIGDDYMLQFDLVGLIDVVV